MNQYSAMAERHWRRWLPSRVAELEDPTSFFSTLGDELAGDDPPGETFLEKAGRLNIARLRAEEIVLPEMVLLPPEAGLDEDRDDDAGRRPTTGRGPTAGGG